MTAWVEKNRVYSSAPDPNAAAIEIDTYAGEHDLRLTVEYQPRAELRGTRHVYLKRIMGKADDPAGTIGVQPFTGLRK